ncbi:hypothetical protein CD58_14675 [Pseudomonas brassicacearum]|uniref:hypothetical protein n=1 Tax=Pseudomonas brassicacearum TaxID=930166 RepID=UPI00042F1FE4|nr:hypothetical protein [Pseudomonas brassicacearum]AHL34079.1 hypothetical protein CD58_14675 [Pseudomonas brassicacearum]
MSLEFATSHILWRPFARENDSPAVDDGQLKVVKDFVNAFFCSHGHSGQAQDAHALRWYAAQDVTFRTMLKQLVGELANQAVLNDLDLVVLAHWTPDVEVGCSVTNAIIYETGAHDAFGMAISDHGLSSTFLALQVIEDYLGDMNHGGQGKKALLLIADQDAILYDSPALARLNPVPSACVVMLRSLPGERVGGQPASIVFKHYRKVAVPGTPPALDTLLVTLDMFTSGENLLPLLILTTPCFAGQLRQHGQLATHRIESWDETLLSSAPWVRSKELATSSQRILWLLPEGKHLVCAGFVAEV